MKTIEEKITKIIGKNREVTVKAIMTVMKEQREEIINMIEGNKQNTRIETGAFKYDFAYDEIIKNI